MAWPAAAQFRSSVAVVAVDVQVVDRAGEPIVDLHAADFEVTIGGRRRAVTSVDLIRHQYADTVSRVDTGPGAPPTEHSSDTANGRTIVVVVDAASFDVGAWQRAAIEARRFVVRLSRDDRLGLYVAPLGPVLAPTTDHTRVLRTLSGIVVEGQGNTFATRYNLRPSEVVDISAEAIQHRSAASAVRRTPQGALEPGSDTATVQMVHMRECPQDPECPAWILLEANSAVRALEARASESVLALRRMTDVLAGWPGRKTVVLLTGGVVVSDRPGGRPDPPDMSRLLGGAAARANAVVYTLHVGVAGQQSNGAARRVATHSGADDLREEAMQSIWLERFSEAAGGALFRSSFDAGTQGWQRILSETAAYYLLGVEPLPEDGDSQPKALRVRVRARDAIVRSRSWVVVAGN